MSSVENHYDTLLAGIYSWMAGGADAAFAVGQADLASEIQRGGYAIDLGAGFGMHAIPLARAGWRVVAIDSSPALLAELTSHAAGLPVRTHGGDLLRFADLTESEPGADLILCMGDTLTHLESQEAIAALAHSVASRLAPGGRFVATFRDYTRLPSGDARFIPVRSDDRRILTCFLEEHPEFVLVHDLVHERTAAGWTTRVSSYRKLRLAPDAAQQALTAAGLRARVEPGPRGMVRLVADA